MIKWKDDYLLGIEIIDEQHKELFRIVERAYALLKNEFLTDKYDRIIAIIEDLKNYAVFHFKTEEEYMQKIGYRRLLSHKVQHDDFLEKVSKIDLESVDARQDQYLLDILEFALNWIDKHILQTDKMII